MRIGPPAHARSTPSSHALHERRDTHTHAGRGPRGARLSTWGGVVEEVTAMINAAYAAGEQGMWRPDTPRIFEAEVRALLDAGELMVVRRDSALAGCVRVHALDESTGELGLLSAARRDSGVGGELVALAEAWARERGLTRMRLTLLVPRTGTHPFKARLHAWYSKLGYRVIARRDFADELPQSARLLTAPCDLVIYEKALSARQRSRPLRTTRGSRAPSRRESRGD